MIGKAFVLTAVVVVIFDSSPCAAQVPRVCAHNASLDGGVCCPSTPDGEEGPVCGGIKRGRCHRIDSTCPPQRTLVPRQLRNDDRLDWPTAFFSFSCVCSHNFDGFACHRCKPGWYGDDCKIRKVAIRRNALKMTHEQMDYFRNVLDYAKYETSHWVFLNFTNSDNGDPISNVPSPVPFYDVSVYDFVVALHSYSARSTLLSTNMDGRCNPSVHQLDFSYVGPGFPTWNRRFLIEVEMELDEVAKLHTHYPEPFTIPYWDWIDDTTCSICTNDLVGAMDPDPEVDYIDSWSTFYNWQMMCKLRLSDNACRICDPSGHHEYLWRNYTSDQRYNRLPTQAEVDYMMSLHTYDLPPYNMFSNASSFRNVLEGYINANNVYHEGEFYMHKLVHLFVNGSQYDVAASPNDPYFLLHHSFLDKILEVWSRKYNFKPKDLPLTGAPQGHNRFDPLVPFFPKILNYQSIGRSEKFGYRYDDLYLGKKNYLI